MYSHALALAADEHVGHGVGDFAGFGQGGVGAVPLGVVDVVAGGASLAVAALAAGAAVQDDFVRSGDPVFVDEEVGSVVCWRGSFGDQSDIGCHSLQL